MHPPKVLLGDVRDDAIRESCFVTSECERLDRQSFQTRAEVCMAVFQFVGGWCNPGRGPWAPGYRSPENFAGSARERLETLSP